MTSIHLLPVKERTWTPNIEFIADVLAHLGATRVRWLNIFSTPRYWDDGDHEGIVPVSQGKYMEIVILGDDPSLIHEALDLPVDDALALLKKPEGVCKVFEPECRQWSDGVWTELSRTLRDLMLEEVTPCMLTQQIGPSSVPNITRTLTAAATHCRIDIEGYGLPNDWDAYLNIVKQNPHYIALKQFVEEKSGFDWTYMISGSW